jgi:signal transduction histidine kinase/CheY-like chemotaxis protein
MKTLVRNIAAFIRSLDIRYGTTLKRKALCIALPGLIIASTVFTYDALKTEKTIMREEIKKRAEVLAHLASRIGELPILSGNDELLRGAISTLKEVPEVSSVALYDSRMHLLMQDGPVLPPARMLPAARHLVIFEEPGYFDLYASVYTEKERQDIDLYHETKPGEGVKENEGWVRIGFSKASIIAAERRIIFKGLIFAIVFTLGIGSFVSVMFGLATKPLSLLSKALNSVRKGEYPEIHVNSNDEVGLLASEYTRMIDAVRDREARLTESRKRISDLFSRVEHAIFRLDSKGRIIETNRKFDELCGRPEDFCSLFVMREGKDRFSEAAAGTFKNAEEKILGVDGAELFVIISLYPESGTNDAVAGFDGYFVDITEKKKLEEAIIQAQKLESIGLLAGGVAHDFNNILTGILGYASLSQSIVSRDSKIFGYMEVIAKSAQRATNLTHQLLGFARKGKYKVEKLSINDIVSELIAFLRETFDRNIAIVLDMEGGLSPVEGDGNQLYQALMNLCINARDAMPSGGRLYIKTEAFALRDERMATLLQVPPGDYVRVGITDVGTGMTAEVKKRIFEPFYTTKGVGKGTGLGLSMVYGIVKNHGGYINVYSEVGLGTTMRVYLPKASGVIEERRKKGVMSSGNKRGTILFIDDEDMVRELGREILEAYDFKVLVAVHGAEGVRMFQEHRENIDLVILDMIMPEKGGRQAFNEIRAIKPEARILLCSGYGQEQSFDELLDAGAVGFLQKPFQHLDLIGKVEEAMKR